MVRKLLKIAIEYFGSNFFTPYIVLKRKVLMFYIKITMTLFAKKGKFEAEPLQTRD